MASIASSSSAQQQWRYDVFLSFRGADVRNNFLSHLYNELFGKGIITFKDDRELRKGDSVPLQLPKAIQDSRILVVIFSKNYADSTWCLNELVKIYECKKGGRQTVLPIFYDVCPAEVRKQEGEFGAPFAEYEKRFEDKIERVQQWRNASTEVANLSGYHLNDRDEAVFIQEIVNEILRQLRRSSRRKIAKDFVGMEPRLKKMNDYLDLGQEEKVRIIGICGLGGIGKTALASVVYMEHYSWFEGCCFLEDVRESYEKKDGAVSLQNELLSATLKGKSIKIYDVYIGSDEIRNRLHRKRILVVLDDVDKLKQIELLIGKRDEPWYGRGSRIIITTRDEHLLKQHRVDVIYKVDELNDDDALKLFRSKACKENNNEEKYLELCHEFVKYASGLPLALDILGSSVCGKYLEVWKSALAKLKKIPNKDVFSILKLSYDGLDEASKQVFLDIACFFKGMDKEYVVEVLESCELFPESGISELIDKSLITIYCGNVRMQDRVQEKGREIVQMHDLVQEMGREIVRRESYEDPGLRSRIWLDQDVNDIQMNSMEAKHVKAIVLRLWKQEEEQLSAKIFSKVKELRLLILQNIPVSQDIEYISNKLMYLEWYECPFKFLPSSFQPQKLVQLDMRSSNMEQLWKTSIRLIESLKIINLSNSKNLIKTPNFRKVPNLEKLNLEGCESLREVHQSIGVLKRLVLVNLKYCVNLAALPDSMRNLKSLKTLNLCGCSNLKPLEWLWDLTNLVEIDASEMVVQHHLRSWLTPWTWKNPHPMAMMFSSLSTLPFLKKLNLSYCNLSEGSIPNDVGGFPSLELLNLSGNNFVSLPSSVSHLSKLYELELSDCRRLQSLPNLPSNIYSVVVKNCISLESLPNLSEEDNVQRFFMNFINNPKLKDRKRNIKVAFEWLRSYLIYFLKIRGLFRILVMWISRDLLEKICQKKGFGMRHLDNLYKCPHFYLKYPGNEIPEWFTYQSFKSVEIRLASFQKWWNIAGFVICFVVSPTAECDQPTFTLEAYSKNKAVARGPICSMQIDSKDLKSDHLYLFFQQNYLLDLYEVLSPTKLKIGFDSGVKKCGVRVVYEKEIQEMMESNEPLENLDPHHQDLAEMYNESLVDESASGSRGWRSFSSEGEEEDAVSRSETKDDSELGSGRVRKMKMIQSRKEGRTMSWNIWRTIEKEKKNRNSWVHRRRKNKDLDNRNDFFNEEYKLQLRHKFLYF